MRSLGDLSSSELSEQLLELDSAIETDQGIIASASKRIKNNYRTRDRILDLLTMQASRKGWR